MPTTNFKNSSGTDIGNTLVEKSYLIDRYPELEDTFKQAGAWAWGYNGQGTLGDNTTAPKSSPVSVVGGYTDWCQISAGTDHSLALRTNGTAWSWGQTKYWGQLGTNSTVPRSSPVSVIGGFTDWCQISAGYRKSLAIRSTPG